MDAFMWVEGTDACKGGKGMNACKGVSERP